MSLQNNGGLSPEIQQMILDLPFFPIVGALILFIIITKHIIAVSTNELVLVEKFGQFKKILKPGIHFLIPFVENVKYVDWQRTVENHSKKTTETENIYTYRISTQETLFDIPEVKVTTKDRLTVVVNCVLFYKIIDAYKAVYEINDVYQSVEQLTFTFIRDAVSKLTLDEAIEGKSQIREAIYQEFKTLEQNWGIKLTKFDIQSIQPTREILEGIEKLAKSQREAQAELEKTRALQEAKKLKIKTELEIDLITMENENKKKVAQASTEASVKQTLIESESLVLQKRVESEALYLQKVLGVKGITQEYILQKEHTKAIEALSSSKSNTKLMIIPMDSARYFGLGSVQSLEKELVLKKEE
ncbi:hypothetical protein ABK040_006320 [Willaertia magna]